MAEYKDLFTEDIEVPEIVMRKANAAFAKIKQEDNAVMSKKKNYKWIFKSKIAAAACICLLAATGITAVAAARHIWSRGMKGMLQATEEQQQVLTDEGMAAVLSETEDYGALAVTDGNITVAPETLIVDDRFVYLSFSVKGYALKEGAEPSFETTQVYLGDDPDAEEGWMNMNACFYDGIVADENGNPVTEDGTAPEIGADGDIIRHYADETGTLEYVIQAYVTDPDRSILGETLHVNLKNMGTVFKTAYTGQTEGNWDFALTLPTVSSAVKIPVAQTVEGTVFVMDSIDLSPVSIRIDYSVNGEVEVSNDGNGIPDFWGVVLKDGTRLPFLKNGGVTAYTDKNRTNAYVLSAFDRVIEPEKVASVLVRTKEGTEMVEVPVQN